MLFVIDLLTALLFSKNRNPHGETTEYYLSDDGSATL